MAASVNTDSLENKSGKWPGGECIGQDADALVSFHGSEPIAQEEVANLAGTLTGTVTGTILDVAADASACAGAATPSASDVDDAIDAVATSIVEGVNLANAETQAILNDLILKLQNKGIIG